MLKPPTLTGRSRQHVHERFMNRRTCRVGDSWVPVGQKGLSDHNFWKLKRQGGGQTTFLKKPYSSRSNIQNWLDKQQMGMGKTHQQPKILRSC